MDEKIKTWTLRFPAKENPNMEKALFDWPIVLCPFFSFLDLWFRQIVNILLQVLVLRQVVNILLFRDVLCVKKIGVMRDKYLRPTPPW